MTTFDKRDKAFENKFAHDEELTFKIHARRNKLLGLWAAAKLDKTADAAEQYASDTVEAEFASSGAGNVIDKLLKDFSLAGLAITAQEIHHEMDQLLLIARQQILGSAD